MNTKEIEKLRNKASRFFDEYLKSEEPQKENELMQLRLRFIHDFDLEYITKNITLNNYCLGKSNRNSFSYRIEIQLRGLGSAKGGASDKFIVFYSNKNQRFQTGQHYPKDVNVAFDWVKEDLYKIYAAAKQDKIEDIVSTRFWYIIKYKIYWTYNPEHDIPVFKRDHVNKIIKKWNISCDKDETSKRKALYDFKTNDPVFSKMTNVQFMHFIYSPYSGLDLKEEDEETENDLFNTIDEIKLENFVGSYENNSKQNKITQKNRDIVKKNVDFTSLQEKKRTLGKFGELLIINDESRKLRAHGIDKLVEHSSVEIGDGLGYDILSYDEKGQFLYIEVKTTTSSRIDGFYLSENERKKAESLKNNYRLYRIYSLNKKTGKYKVAIFTYDELFDRFSMIVTQYQVEEK